MLRRLEIGLVDEGCRVVRVTPESSFPEPSAGLAAALEYGDSPWRVLGPSPIKRLSRVLDENAALGATDEDGPIDVVHAWGEGCWPLGLALARELEASVALEVGSRRGLGLVQSIERRVGGMAGLWLAPDAAMSVAVQRAAKRWPVRTSLWGVHVPDADAGGTRAEGAIESISLCASGREPQALMDLCAALARVKVSGAEPMLFLDASAVEAAPLVWKHAGALGLLPRLTLVPRMESRRDLVLRTDAMIVVDCQGEHKSLVLEAMAAGMTLISRADRLVEVASEPSCAMLVDEPSEIGWSRAVSWLLSKPEEARAFGRAAREHVSRGRLAHLQVRAALDAYALFLKDQPIPIREAQRG